MDKYINFKQLKQLVVSIFFEMVREPAVLFWGIMFPMLMSLGLGVAFNTKVDVVRKVAVVSNVETVDSKIDSFLKAKTSIAKINNNQYNKLFVENKKIGNTTFLFLKTDLKNAEVLLKRSVVSLILIEKNNKVEYHFHTANADAQLSYMKLVHLFENKASLDELNIVPLDSNGLRYVDFLIPGLVGLGIMMSCIWGISYGIIEKRSKKLLRRMVATPMKKSHFLVALMIVRSAMNFLESFLLVLFAWIVFDFQIQGSWLALFFIFVSGNIVFAGIGVFIASRTSKTEVGNGYINAVVMPMMVLSGIFFSYHNFPDWSINIIQKFPLTIMVDNLRMVFIEGAGISQIALSSLIMCLTGIFFFVLGLKIFKWH